MPSEAIWLILFVVAMLAAPFATLRALSHLRARKLKRKPPPEEPDEPDRPSGYW
ncbi:hypothetical protein [Panacagrimonas sp.]|uniref:hypothetical protein n=1 Tax=Panacagrimonas sp. TaxID=2480088 RepID=UPI003B520803